MADHAVDPRRPYAFLCERERTAGGEIEEVATIFLTNRECPWRCLMCDLWRNTTNETVPAGAIAEQIEAVATRMDSLQVTTERFADWLASRVLTD